MDIKKVLFASLFGCAMMLTSCGGGGNPTSNGETGGSQDTPATSEGQTSQADLSALNGTYDITMWVSEIEGVAEQFASQIDAFEEANPGIVINPTIEGVTEADSMTKMLTDIDAGADIFCFAQDQFARGVQGGALAKLGKAAAATVQESNSAGSVAAVTAGNELYAYPLTADNGYFMYYDKTVIQESSVGSLEAIIADCVAADRNFSFELENAWYTASFFFGTGCHSNWKTNDNGDFISIDDTFNSAEGFVAAKNMKKLVSSPVYVNSSATADFAAAIPSAVVVSGIWNYENAKENLGDNLGIAELPSFTDDASGKSYHIGSYSGYKLMGVKPQSDPKRLAVLHQLTQYLTNAKCQEQRFDSFSWGPSNKETCELEKVKANEALQALSKQDAYATPQGQIHGGWWDLAKVIATDVKNATDDAGIQAALDKYTEGLNAIFTAAPIWGMVGSMAASDWKNNIDMTEKDGKWELTYELAANDQFKFRINSDWDTALGASATTVAAGLEANFDLVSNPDGNIVCLVGGTYNFVVDPATSTVTISQ